MSTLITDLSYFLGDWKMLIKNRIWDEGNVWQSREVGFVSGNNVGSLHGKLNVGSLKCISCTM